MQMNIEQLKRLDKELARLLSDTLPREVGKIARDHFRENFIREGFVDGGLRKWKDVKRRNPRSPWYGFEYKGERRTSYRYKRDSKTGKTYKDKKQKRLNFSQTATQRPPLRSKRNELMRSIRVLHARDAQVSVGTDLPYAQVQNDGGVIKVFGKHPVRLSRRQFIGPSIELDAKVTRLVNLEIKRLFRAVGIE